MTLLAFLLTAVLVLIAALHLLWAIGFWWPIRDETALTRAVVGQRGRTRMPGAVPCALVVVALSGAAIWPLALLLGAVPPFGAFGGAVLALVFLSRGIATWLPGWRRRFPEQPFAAYDRRFYGPLCLALGLAYTLLTGSIL